MINIYAFNSERSDYFFCFSSLNINAYSKGIHFIKKKKKQNSAEIETCREITLQIPSPNYIKITILTFTATTSHQQLQLQ